MRYNSLSLALLVGGACGLIHSTHAQQYEGLGSGEDLPRHELTHLTGDLYRFRQIRDFGLVAVTPDGIIHTLAGDVRQKGHSGDGGPASKARIWFPFDVVTDLEGNLYFTDRFNHCIRKIDGKTRVITTIAGTGEPGFSGDGGPAKLAQFNFLMCVTLNSANDKIYCADLKNRRIRVVDLKSGWMRSRSKGSLLMLKLFLTL